MAPILGYCFDPDTADGDGHIIERRAKGQELYDGAAVCSYQVWTRNESGRYLKSEKDAKEYLLTRRHAIADIPQAHFDTFMQDISSTTGRAWIIECFH